MQRRQFLGIGENSEARHAARFVLVCDASRSCTGEGGRSWQGRLWIILSGLLVPRGLWKLRPTLLHPRVGNWYLPPFSHVPLLPLSPPNIVLYHVWLRCLCLSLLVQVDSFLPTSQPSQQQRCAIGSCLAYSMLRQMQAILWILVSSHGEERVFPHMLRSGRRKWTQNEYE